MSNQLADRFTEAQKEKAEAISNDISEDIDNDDSKEDLRMAVDYWASVAADYAMKLSMKQINQVLIELRKLRKQLDKQERKPKK